MHKRIFLGCPISQELKQNIIDWQGLNDLDVDWIMPEKLHITVIPPWQISEGEIKELIHQLTVLIDPMDGFNLQFNEIKSISRDDDDDPRYIWLIGNQSVHLSLIQNVLLSHFGFEKQRDFQLHITLARLKKKNEKIHIAQPIDWKEHIGQIYLYESSLGDSRNQYETLAIFNLKD